MLTPYARELATDYGLKLVRTGNVYRMELDGEAVVFLEPYLDTGYWSWRVHPLGTQGDSPRLATGIAETIDGAVEDSEAVLRHYLQNPPMNVLSEVWPLDVLRRNYVLRAA